MDTTQSLLEAVNALINTRDHQYVIDALDAVSSINSRFPVAFKDGLAVYNPLLEIKITDPESYANLQALIDRKREAAGLPLCWPPVERTRFNKGEYQRQVMAVRRGRAGRATEIENAQRPPQSRLVGNPRLVFEKQILRVWGDVLDQKLKAVRDGHGGRIPKERLDAIRKSFWDEIDQKLDDAEQELARENVKPSHMRKRVAIPLMS